MTGGGGQTFHSIDLEIGLRSDLVETLPSQCQPSYTAVCQRIETTREREGEKRKEKQFERIRRLPLEWDLLGVAGLGETVRGPPLAPAAGPAAAAVAEESLGGRCSPPSSSSDVSPPPVPVCFFIRAWISFPESSKGEENEWGRRM